MGLEQIMKFNRIPKPLITPVNFLLYRNYSVKFSAIQKLRFVILRFIGAKSKVMGVQSSPYQALLAGAKA